MTTPGSRARRGRRGEPDPPLGLGRRLRNARLSAGLSQSDLAERSGIPKPRLSQYENARLTPSLATLWRIAAHLGVSAGALVDGEELDLVFLAELRRLGDAFDDAEDARRAAAQVARRRTGFRRGDAAG